MRPPYHLLALGLLLPLTTVADPGITNPSNPQAWLTAMAQALRHLNYEGELIYQHGQSLETLHQRHWVEGDEEREHLINLNGPLRELVRGPKGAHCRLSSTESVATRPINGLIGLPSLDGLTGQGLEPFYTLELGGQTRLVGRQAQIIEIHPKDEFRYGFRIYLDQKSHLPLKQLLLDAKGEPLVSLMYSRLEVESGKAPAAPLARQQHSIQHPHLQSESAPVTGRHWQLQQLPPGFQAYLPKPDPEDARDNLEHRVLSDGLVTVSLYIEPASEADLNGALRKGATGAYGLRLGDYQVTAVGEVPEAALRHIVEAIRLTP